MNILLITPPLVQLNCPYPATTQLKAYMDANSSHVTYQKDMSIELVKRIYCRQWLEPAFQQAFEKDRLSGRAKSVAMNKKRYLDTVENVVRFLQGKDNSLATRIATGGFLPEGNRFRKVDDDALEWAFGTTTTGDKAKFLASLYMTDLADFIGDVVTPNFALIRYGEQLSLSAPVFEYIDRAVKAEGKPMNDVDRVMLEILDEYMSEYTPDFIGFTVPFPGCLYATLKCAQHIKIKYPKVKIAIGGGYVNTELRSMTDATIFNYIDYMLFDDGELPLMTLIEHIQGERELKDVVRLKYRAGDNVVDSLVWDKNEPFENLPAPSYDGIDVTEYISLIELTNPMHKMWSDGFWNKMTVAHGCYWAKCTFCDTTLDYIGRYDAPSASTVVDRMEVIMKCTGQSGFHFTDEALPPKLLKEIAEEILKRDLTVSYWGNVRFEKSFTTELCELLASSGCVAVSGGLEVASDRILKLINKGVSIQQAAIAANNFTSAGIMVHAYLMYGFPTQTMQESVDSLDIVRQMFEEGLLQSAFWHRYTMTVHSPSGCAPDKFGAKRLDTKINSFANNGVKHIDDSSDIESYDKLGEILYKVTYNYMHGSGYDIPMRNWFESKAVNPTVPKNLIARIIGD